MTTHDSTREAPFVGPRYPEVERRSKLSAEEFHNEYVDRKPVVVQGATDQWRALSRWNASGFRELAGDMLIKVKPGFLPDGNFDFMPLGAYIDILEEYEEKLKKNEAGPEDRPPYLHDIPLLATMPGLIPDVDPFPDMYLAKWYRKEWWKFSQFFYGSSHSLTPLHFDSLETHNTFFQISGRKRFILVAPEDRDKCYVYKWRWSAVDPESPDWEKYPKFRDARVQEAVVGPGDVLYMPSGTLHHVRSLDLSISFNIDWQTRSSALRGILGAFRGMPIKNVYYNSIAGLGLWFGLPHKVLYPMYRSYLDYIS